MAFGSACVESNTSKKGESMEECGEKGKNCSGGENIVEVCNYIVGVVERDVERGICQNNSSNAPYSE